MTVYVDDAYIPFQPRYPRHPMEMCHMAADSLEELHAMADRIGMQRRWFQGEGKIPHYDVGESKRALAVHHGAVEVTQRELVRWWKAKEAEGTAFMFGGKLPDEQPG